MKQTAFKPAKNITKEAIVALMVLLNTRNQTLILWNVWSSNWHEKTIDSDIGIAAGVILAEYGHHGKSIIAILSV